jgi:hypothetical protein
VRKKFYKNLGNCKKPNVMLRLVLITSLVLLFRSPVSAQWPLLDLVEEYKNAKDGITLNTIISLRDTAGRQTLDAFLNHLCKKLKRSDQNFKILIAVDWITERWNGAIGFDTVRLDYNAIMDYYNPPSTGDTIDEVVIEEIDNKTVFADMPKELSAPDWNISYNKKEKDLGLKILYKCPISDTSVFFDKIYSLTQFGLDHLEKIKSAQKRMEVKYSGYPLSVLSLDTAEIKQIPLKHSGFDPGNLHEEKKNNWMIWFALISGLSALVFFGFRKISLQSNFRVCTGSGNADPVIEEE